MGIIQTLCRWFETESYLRTATANWARAHFPGPLEEAARAVAYSVITELGINFNQITPGTDIVADLGADEWDEWAGIQIFLEEELKCHFAPEPHFTGRTVAELVVFAAAFRQPVPPHPPTRTCFPPTGWCLVECLRQPASGSVRPSLDG